MTIKEMHFALNRYCAHTQCIECKLNGETCNNFVNGHLDGEMVKRNYCLVFGDSGVAAPDQKLKADAGKPRLSLVPMQILWDVAAVREWATANKYPDPESWKKVEVGRYRDALLRHVLRYIDNPDGVDDESGLPHLYHVATNVAFLAELEAEK